MTRITGLMVAGVVLGVMWLVGGVAFPRTERAAPLKSGPPVTSAADAEREEAIASLNTHFADLWREQQLTPADRADDLTIFRRMSLGLHGTVPSLEEIRHFEADAAPDRLERWCAAMLADPRFFEYFGERFTRMFVGTQGEPFLIFRRDRFKSWIVEQLRQNRPYDQWVRELLSDTGLWTGEPATNFITHAVIDQTVNAEKLTGRTVRAVLGQRIDCAECHDHPFADWKQRDFQRLAAFYGQVRFSAFGVEDRPEQRFQVTDRKTLAVSAIEPKVPFGESWLPEAGSFRQRLAQWSTAPENRRFSRATVNRIWALLFGKAFSEGAPYFRAVDDLPDPELTVPGTSEAESNFGTALDLLAEDFRTHGHDLRRLILIIALSDVFQRSSETEITDDAELRRHLDHWAVYPLVRLRPEQIVGSLLQATSIRTVDQNSALLSRTIRLLRERDFVNDYGDLGEDELSERAGTLPQALLRMNGKLVTETTEPNPFNATPRIGLAAASPERLLETGYLLCLTRRPTEEETAHFLNTWAEAPATRPGQRMQDLYWTLINSPEFSWNH